MTKTVSETFSARENSPDRALQNANKKIGEYMAANPGSRVISTSHSFTSRLGALPEKPAVGGEVLAHIVAVFELP